MTTIAVYVDDLILINATAEEMQRMKESLTIQYKMTDMGNIHYCLGVSIVQNESEKTLWLHYKQYVQNMLQKQPKAKSHLHQLISVLNWKG